MAGFWKRFAIYWNLPQEKKEQNYWQDYYKKNYSDYYKNDYSDYYEEEEEESDYGWLKKAVISIMIFLLVYGAYVSDTPLGRETVNMVRKILHTNTDYVYWINRGKDYTSRHFPNALNWSQISFINDVQATISKPADPLLYMSKPVEGRIKTGYGWQNDPVLKQEIFYEGIDVLAPAGTSVRSAAPGKVKFIGDNGNMGAMVIVEHGQNIETVYAYLGEVLVKNEEFVSQGQVIARVGKVKKNKLSPADDEPGLYFEVRQDGKAIDPLTRIGGEFLR